MNNRKFFQEVLNEMAEQIQEFGELPDEIPPTSILSDQELSIATTNSILEYIFRTDKPLHTFAWLVHQISNTLIENINEWDGHSEPKLREPWRAVHQKVQRNRAMYLQWEELKGMQTTEDQQ